VAARHGRLGETAARRHLQSKGWKFLTANYRTRRGEIDLVFREGADLVFVEVKTRSSEEWRRPAAAIRSPKRRRLSKVAMEYLRAIHHPTVKVRFDVVEVLLEDGKVAEIRHLPNAFPFSAPYRYG
jgi:putative endonuclease